MTRRVCSRRAKCGNAGEPGTPARRCRHQIRPGAGGVQSGLTPLVVYRVRSNSLTCLCASSLAIP
jgi:hypothetical protein